MTFSRIKKKLGATSLYFLSSLIILVVMRKGERITSFSYIWSLKIIHLFLANNGVINIITLPFINQKINDWNLDNFDYSLSKIEGFNHTLVLPSQKYNNLEHSQPKIKQLNHIITLPFFSQKIVIYDNLQYSQSKIRFLNHTIALTLPSKKNVDWNINNHTIYKVIKLYDNSVIFQSKFGGLKQNIR